VHWVLPLTVLLQLATVGRILIEHRFPDPAHSGERDKVFQCRATLGVFPGSAPPAHDAATLRGFVAWAGWWAAMLTVQLLVRVLVLVADAPCHDFHHRRPSSRAGPSTPTRGRTTWTPVAPAIRSTTARRGG